MADKCRQVAFCCETQRHLSAYVCRHRQQHTENCEVSVAGGRCVVKFEVDLRIVLTWRETDLFNKLASQCYQLNSTETELLGIISDMNR